MDSKRYQRGNARGPEREGDHRGGHPPGRWALLAATALAVLLVAAACTGDQTSGSQGATDLQLPADFQLTLYQGEELLGGKTLNFSDLFAQGKPVVLNFWGAACPPCRFEMPHFQRVYQEHREDLTLLGLDVGPFTLLGTSEQAQALLRELHITYPAGAPPNGSAMITYGASGLPTTVFLAADGTVYETWVGILTEDKLMELVEGLLAFSQTL